jgi:outer membrane protein TolC
MNGIFAASAHGLRRVGLVSCVLVLVAGCVAPGPEGRAGQSPDADPQSDQTAPQAPARADPAGSDAQYVLGGQYLTEWQSALRAQSEIGALAERANARAVERSPTVFAILANEAESRAERAAWFPNIRPVASLALGSGAAGIGVSASQLIYDFSQTRSRRERAEIARSLTEIAFWDERNLAVRDVLRSYVEAVEAAEILGARRALEHRLARLAAQEADRRHSGVSGDGETLFLEVSGQENRRSMIRQDARLADARARLFSNAGVTLDPTAPLAFAAVEGGCERPVMRDHAPDLMRARMAIELARMEAEVSRRALLPRLIGSAEMSSQPNGTLTETGRIGIEGGTLLGGGGQYRVEAARQRSLAAQRSYQTARSDLSRERDRLTIEERALRTTLTEYHQLVQTTERSLSLFRDRFAAGAATVSEAVRLEVERTANLVAVAETRAALVRNCIDAAHLYGALAPADAGLPRL